MSIASAPRGNCSLGAAMETTKKLRIFPVPSAALLVIGEGRSVFLRALWAFDARVSSPETARSGGAGSRQLRCGSFRLERCRLLRCFRRLDFLETLTNRGELTLPIQERFHDHRIKVLSRTFEDNRLGFFVSEGR